MNKRVLDQVAVLQRRIEYCPTFRKFFEGVEATLTDDPESLLACEDLLVDLARSYGFEEFLAHELASLGQDATHSIPNSRDVSVDILATDRWDLGVHLHRPRPETIPPAIGCPAESILSIMVHGSLHNQMFEVPGGPAGNSVFVRGLKLVPRGVHTITTDRVSYIRAGRDAHYTLAPEGEAMSLNLVYLDAVPLRWTFDSSTLEALHASAGSVTLSRIEYAMKVLTLMPIAESVPTLERLATHPVHFVRWTAIRQMGLLAPERARHLLKLAQNDPHPHVRNAALLNLDRIAGAVAAAQEA